MRKQEAASGHKVEGWVRQTVITKTDAISLLVACKELVERVNVAYPNKTPPSSIFTEADLQVIRGFDRLQADPIAAGPGLLGHLEVEAGLSKSDIIKLEQVRRLVYNRRHFVANTKSG